MMNMIRYPLIALLLITSTFIQSAYANGQSSVIIKEHNAVDMVIFSFDRPLQLYALLESIETYMTGVATIHVIYRTSNQTFARAYQEVQERFNYVTMLPQSDCPRDDFKPLVLKAVFESEQEHVVFAVDDIIVTDYVNLVDCVELMKATGAYGFYLKMGKNLSACYSLSQSQPLPEMHQVVPGVYAWAFARGACDWGYPNTVDMTIYCKKSIEHHLRSLSYYAPNTFEACWAGRQYDVWHRHGLCYETTKVVNIPLNRVNQEMGNKHMNYLTVIELLTLFNDRKKIDIKPLFQIKNQAVHMPYEPTFLERN